MKLTKILVSAVVLLCFSFTCIGYASLTDELTVSGAVSYTPPPKTIDYLYVSGATILDEGSNDKVQSMDGSTDYTNQKGWVSLTLDFTTSDTRTVEIELTNLSIANLAFYQLECMGATATVDSADLVAGEFNSETNLVEVQEEYIAENEANQQTNKCIIVGNGGMHSGITVTVKSDSAAVLNVMISFLHAPFTKAAQDDIIGNATLNSAIAMLLASLNMDEVRTDYTDAKHNGKTPFDAIVDEMSENTYGWGQGGDYVGNVIGAGLGSTDSNLIKDIFGDTLDSIALGEEKEKPCTVMLKHEDITHANTEEFERTWYGTYRAVNPIDEMTLYMSTTDPSKYDDGTARPNGSSIPVWAVVLYQDRETGTWAQYGDIYKGTATTNAYTAGGGNNSFDTGTWRADGVQTFAVIMEDDTRPTYTVSDNSNIKSAIRAYEEISNTNPHFDRGTP